MAKQVLNRGAVADDPVADTLYDAAGKIINNFDELYAHTADTTNPHGVTAEQAGADPAGTAAAAVATHEAASDPHPQYLTEAAATTALAGKADLVGGVVPTAQIPALAVTEYLGSVASEAAMLALAGQKGDWAIRTDSATVWIVTGDDPTQLAGWTQLAYPTGNVSSVNGQTGVVVLSAADVGADPAGQNAPKASTFGVVIHNADPNAARPPGYALIYWIGSVDPVNKAAGDIVLNTSDPAPYTPSDADSAATASKLILRDAAGRAQVADPAVDADIATKGYVDANAGGGTALGPPVLTLSSVRQLSLPGVGITKIEALSVTGTRIVYQPIRLRAARTLRGLHSEVTTAGPAASLFRIGLYPIDAAYVLGSPVAQSGDLPLDALGVQSLTGLNIACPAGDYLLAIHPSATAGFRCATGSFVDGHPLNSALGTNVVNSMLFALQTYGALPDPGAPITNTVQGSVLMSWFVFPEWS